MTSGPARFALASPENRPLLDVQDVGIAFGGLKAVNGFSLQLPERSLYGLIGPNGAGKTTVFNLLTGVYRPDRGGIRLARHDLTGRKPHEITLAGVARTFQNIRLFGEMSVLDNVRLAAQLRRSVGALSTFFRGPRFHRCEADLRDRALELLDVMELRGDADAPARSLSYGHQRRLEIARALATRPKVLLLDEPAAGMNPQEKQSLAKLIESLPERFELSVLLIDHDMGLVMKVCRKITVLDHGEIIAVGPPDRIQNDPNVIAAYLGEPTPDA
ncbi:MAG: ABC transporter ATP-binding protein [Planctomyces sp.]|nr:ABC transporter ATP-binding protein [Planctomyces sp.]